MWRVNSCCACFPLRKGLLVFSYIIIVLNYISILNFMFKFNDLFNMKHSFDPTSSIALSLAFAYSVVHFIYTIVFLSALHKNSAGLIEHYYHFLLVMLMIEVAGAAFYIPLVVYQKYPLMGYDVVKLFLALIILASIMIAFNLYVVVLVYSVMSDMREEKERTQEIDDVVEPSPSIQLTQQKRESLQY